MSRVLLIFVCVSIFIFQNEASVSDIILKPCNATGPSLAECWIQKIEDLRPNLIKGIQEWQLPSIDPLYFPRLSVGKRKLSAVSYQAFWKNIVFSGGKDFQILATSIDPNGLVFKLKIAVPMIHLTAAPTELEGNVIGFHLEGDGRIELDLTSVVIDLVLDGERYNKDGKDYIQWKEGSIEISYDTVYAKVYELIKDPFELLIFNHAVNARIEAFKGAIRSFMDRTLGNFIIRSINHVHEKFPAETLYPI